MAARGDGRAPARRIAATPDGLPESYQPPDGMHAGDWRLHHLALPAGLRGDFTPSRKPGYAEERSSPHGELARFLLLWAWLVGATERAAEHQVKAQAEPDAGR